MDPPLPVVEIIPRITLIGCDHTAVELRPELARLSTVISAHLDRQSSWFVSSKKKQNLIITFPYNKVTGAILILLVQWLAHHYEDTYEDWPAEVPKPELYISPWNQWFLNRLKLRTIYELCIAAEHLKIDPLREVLLRKISCKIEEVSQRKRSLKEIKRELGLEECDWIVVTERITIFRRLTKWANCTIL